MSPSLFTPGSGFSRSAIMSAALKAAHASLVAQRRLVQTPGGIKANLKVQSWSFLLSHHLKAQWAFARAEQAKYWPKPTGAEAWALSLMMSDGRIAA